MVAQHSSSLSCFLILCICFGLEKFEVKQILCLALWNAIDILLLYHNGNQEGGWHVSQPWEVVKWLPRCQTSGHPPFVSIEPLVHLCCMWHQKAASMLECCIGVEHGCCALPQSLKLPWTMLCKIAQLQYYFWALYSMWINFILQENEIFLWNSSHKFQKFCTIFHEASIQLFSISYTPSTI